MAVVTINNLRLKELSYKKRKMTNVIAAAVVDSVRLFYG